MLGCTDSNANNYNADATQMMVLVIMIFSVVQTVMQTNYNADATADDGSCTYDVSGCTDNTANNYNADATIDDGHVIIQHLLLFSSQNMLKAQVITNILRFSIQHQRS